METVWEVLWNYFELTETFSRKMLEDSNDLVSFLWGTLAISMGNMVFLLAQIFSETYIIVAALLAILYVFC